MNQPREILVCTYNLGNCPVDRLTSTFKLIEGPSECEVMPGKSLSSIKPNIVPEGIDTVVVHHFTEHERKVNAHRLRFSLGQLSTRLGLRSTNLFQDHHIRQELTGQEKVTPARHSVFPRPLVFHILWDFFSRNELLRFPAWPKASEFLLCSLHSIKIRLRRCAEAPQVADFHIAITIGELHRHLGAHGVHLRCESPFLGPGNALHVVAINQLPTARTECSPIFECRCVSWVPAIEPRMWPSTVLPLCTAHDAEAAIVRLALLGYHREGCHMRGRLPLGFECEVGRQGDPKTAP